MASVQDTERECAALRDRTIKECDKMRAQALEASNRIKAQAEKEAKAVREGADDERIKKLMRASPRRVELLQEIKELEKEKGTLKGKLEAFERNCERRNALIDKHRDRTIESTNQKCARLLSDAEVAASKARAGAEAHLLVLEGKRRAAEGSAAQAILEANAAENRRLAAVASEHEARQSENEAWAAYGRSRAAIEKLKKDISEL